VLSCDDDDDDDDEVVGEEDGATATAPPLPLLEAGIRRVAPLIIFSPLSIDNDDDRLLSRTPHPQTIGVYIDNVANPAGISPLLIAIFLFVFLLDFHSSPSSSSPSLSPRH
jgi:hypothetical protein